MLVTRTCLLCQVLCRHNRRKPTTSTLHYPPSDYPLLELFHYLSDLVHLTIILSAIPHCRPARSDLDHCLPDLLYQHYLTFVNDHLFQPSLAGSSLNYPLIKRVGSHQSIHHNRFGLSYVMASILGLQVRLGILRARVVSITMLLLSSHEMINRTASAVYTFKSRNLWFISAELAAVCKRK